MILLRTRTTFRWPTGICGAWLRRSSLRVVAVALVVFVSLNCVRAAEPAPDSFAGLADEYRTQTRPLLQQ